MSPVTRSGESALRKTEVKSRAIKREFPSLTFLSRLWDGASVTLTAERSLAKRVQQRSNSLVFMFCTGQRRFILHRFIGESQEQPIQLGAHARPNVPS